jgi:lipopolysaccharide/colanic/teichoic acid biosynthesis glycosyltransferase
VTLTELEPLTVSRPPAKSILILDRCLACVLAAASAPVLVAAAAALALLSRRSPFIAHLRVGRNARPFWVWKLRTMWSHGQRGRFAWIERIVAEPRQDSKPARDPRVVSRFAAFCRRYSIDELPQLWQVIGGEMSLVGPRPLTRAELVRHYGAGAHEILSVRPGLTGLWQVGGRSNVPFALRVEMDRALVRQLSLGTYLKTLARTIPAILSGDGAW